MTFSGTAGPLDGNGRAPEALRWGIGATGGEQGAAEGIQVAFVGRPAWSRGSGPLEPASPASIAAAFRHDGRRFLERLHGDFALAVADPSSRIAVLAVDRVGVQRMAWARNDGGLAFSSSAATVAAALPGGRRLRRQALFDFLLLHMVPAPGTVYDGVEKLRAGCCVELRDGRAAVHRYWQPAFVEAGAADEAALGEELRATLRAAVEYCAPDDSTGAFLSGGLDSSSVSGMLARVAPGARTFSMGFGVDAFDELAYARVASRHFGCNATEYSVTPDDVVRAFPLIAGAYDEPFGNSSAVPTYMCAHVAASHGVTHLLAGDGGDEIFGGNERYARQRVFEAYWSVPQALRRMAIEPLSRLIPAEFPVTPLRKLRSYVDQARIPMPERLESWNMIYRTDLRELLDADFLGSIDPRAPLRAMADVYGSAPSSNLLHRMLFFDWQYTLSDNDLRKVGTMCTLAGVRVSYPMLDTRMLELSCRIPPGLKMRGNELRSFYKRAMGDFLPREIIEKTKHGFGLPFGVWLKEHAPLRDLIFGHLESLKGRGIVRREFVDRILAEQRSGHAGYFGYAIWDLAMLDAWLARAA